MQNDFESKPPPILTDLGFPGCNLQALALSYATDLRAGPLFDYNFS